MEILDMPVSEIVPYENNPRNNEAAVEKVMKSIQEFGFKVPIVVDAEKVVLAGHTRLLAAKELGLEKVPVIVAADLDDAKAKAFRLADNKVAEFSGWDFEKLDEELSGLSSITDMDLQAFGFESASGEDLDDLFEDAGGTDMTFDGSEGGSAGNTAAKKKTVTCPHCGETFEV